MSSTQHSLRKLNTRLIVSPKLWSGRLADVADPHLDLLLARGFLPYRRPRGTCEVRGSLANLWYAAAKALEFEVASIRCPDPHFVRHIQGLGMPVKSLASLPRCLRRPHQLPDVVFLDVASIPLGPEATKYWEMWTTTHLFYYLGSDDSVAVGNLGHQPSGTALTHSTPRVGSAVSPACAP